MAIGKDGNTYHRKFELDDEKHWPSQERIAKEVSFTFTHLASAFLFTQLKKVDNKIFPNELLQLVTDYIGTDWGVSCASFDELEAEFKIG